MPDEDFKRGEAKAKLENIESDIGEIKFAMREHNISDKMEFSKLNDKIDVAATAARSASDLAKEAGRKGTDQEKVNDARHAENAKSLESIKKTVESIQGDLNNTKLRMYLLAAFLGGGTGAAAPWLKDLFM